MNAPADGARRYFLGQAAGLAIGFCWLPASRSEGGPAPPLPGSLKDNPRLDSWLHIRPDGKVLVLPGKVEFGQGIVTALQQIVADELDVDLARIELVPTTTGLSPNEGVTSGSQSIEYGGTALRYACAEVRAMLLGRAAAVLGASAGDLHVRDGSVFGKADAATSYWQLCDTRLLEVQATARFAPKPASEHRLIGTSLPRVDIPAKVSGEPAYVQDLCPPGMLHARVVRPAAPRARLIGCDLDGSRHLPGVVAVIRDGSFLAVVATREEQAIDAWRALRKSARWDLARDLPADTADWLGRMKSARSIDTTIGFKESPLPANASVLRIAAEFSKPFTAHAPLAPSCALAVLEEDLLTVWTQSQGVYPLRKDMARVLGLAVDKVRCIHAEGSGMYGHSGADDVALDAALVARALPGRPVRVQWMREDEFQWEPYGSAMIMRLEAGVDPAGNVVDWQHELWSHPHSTRPGEESGSNLLASWYLEHPQAPSPPRNIPQPAGGSDRNAIPLYSFPSQKIVNHLVVDMPVRVSALRTLGAYANVFAIESMMDELAQAAHVDPVRFRLNHLQDVRAKAVIERAAQIADWRADALRSSKDGRLMGRGLGFAKYKNLAIYVAVVADVTVDPRSGAVRVTQLCAAADAGLVINPDGLRNQIEGGLLQATSWTLFESVPFDHERIGVQSWADYPVLRFSDVPKLRVEVIGRPEEKPLGAGEGALGPCGGAIANAVACAIGRRVVQLPLVPERIKSALDSDAGKGGVN
jgi:CO/xanthine dehydrogenase Mo-binding subunit